MSHPTTRRKTSRVEVDLQPSSPFSIQSSRRNLRAAGRGQDKIVREAAAISEAFGVGQDFASGVLERRASRFADEGRLAALEGREGTPEEKTQDSFLNAYQDVTDRRDFIDAEASLTEELQKLDVLGMNPQQFQDFLNLQSVVFLGNPDLDDPIERRSMQEQSQRWMKLEATAREFYHDAHTTALENEVDATLAVDVNDEMQRSGTIDLEALNRDMFRLFGPQNANDELVALVTSAAIRLGNPELIIEMQAKRHWNGGAAAPAGIRKYDGVLQNALNMARNQQSHNENLQEKEDTDAADALTDKIGRGIVAFVSGPAKTGTDQGNPVGEPVIEKSGPARAIELIVNSVARGDLEPEAARVWLNWTNSYSKSQLAGTVTDQEVYRELTISIAGGTTTTEDIIEKATSLSAADIAVLTSRNRAVASARRADPKFTSRLAIVRARFSAPKEVMDSDEYGPAAAEEQARKMSEYMDAYFGGADPDKAMEALGAPTKWIDLIVDAAITPAVHLKRWRDGLQGSIELWISSRPPGTRKLTFLLDEKDAGVISAAEYLQAKKDLKL